MKRDIYVNLQSIDDPFVVAQGKEVLGFNCK